MIDFQEIMKYSKSNPIVFKELYEEARNLNIIPYVGAGLSVPFQFPTWPNTIKQIASLVDDDSFISEINKIAAAEPIEAAERLSEKIGLQTIFQSLKTLFSKDINADQLNNEAASILPLLFGTGYTITTNYDHVLEKAYSFRGKPFERVITPSRIATWQTAQQRNLHVLFKVHGDVSENIAEDIVFTKQQYSNAYGKTGLARNYLSSILNNRVLLFLGCSLEQDWIIDLLKEITADNQNKHFTIINCSAENRDCRRKQLDDSGIRAILYPEGAYESVAIVLEELLKRIYPEKYKAIHPQSIDRLHPFDFTSNSTVLIGRDSEIKQLQDFIEDESSSIRWCAVTGVGGSGKSKLVSNFGNSLDCRRWEYIRVGRGDEFSFQALTSRTQDIHKNLFLVIDNDASDMEPLCRWITSRYERRTQTSARIVICNRLPIIKSTSEFSNWYSSIVEYNEVLPTLQYCFPATSALNIQPLDIEDMAALIVNYAQTVYPQSNDIPVDDILKQLAEIDSINKRPLFALLITDAYLNKNDLHRLNSQDALLNYAFLRERSFIRQKIQSAFRCTFSQNKQLYEEIELSYTKAVEFYLGHGRRIGILGSAEAHLDEDEFRTLCDCFELTIDGSVPPVQPDLLGEYFFLRNIPLLRSILVNAQDFWVPFFRDYYALLSNQYRTLFDELYIFKGLISLPLYYTQGLYEAFFSSNDLEERKNIHQLLSSFAARSAEELSMDGIAERKEALVNNLGLPDLDEDDEHYVDLYGNGAGFIKAIYTPLINEMLDIMEKALNGKESDNRPHLGKIPDYQLLENLAAEEVVHNLYEAAMKDKSTEKALEALNKLAYYYEKEEEFQPRSIYSTVPESYATGLYVYLHFITIENPDKINGELSIVLRAYDTLRQLHLLHDKEKITVAYFSALVEQLSFPRPILKKKSLLYEEIYSILQGQQNKGELFLKNEAIFHHAYHVADYLTWKAEELEVENSIIHWVSNEMTQFNNAYHNQGNCSPLLDSYNRFLNKYFEYLGSSETLIHYISIVSFLMIDYFFANSLEYEDEIAEKIATNCQIVLRATWIQGSSELEIRNFITGLMVLFLCDRNCFSGKKEELIDEINRLSEKYKDTFPDLFENFDKLRQ